MKIIKLIVGLLALAAIGSADICAQNATITPYSRYGYGILSDNASAAQQGMGGVGYAMNSGRQINAMNPASYARMDSLTFLFDMGATMTNLWTTEDNAAGHSFEKHTGAGLSYITLQFPVSKRLGISAGLLPFGSVGYAFGNTINNGAASRQGSGSINQVYAGAGYRLFNELTLGVNVAYLFGSTINDTYAYGNSGSTSLYEREIAVRDYRFTFGLQYTLNLDRNNSVVLGLVYSPAKKLLGHTNVYTMDVNNESSATTADHAPTDDFYSLPHSFGAGIAWNWRQRLLVELDATYQKWAECKYDGETGTLNDRKKLALGVQYQPALRGSYFRRVQYRFGASYEDSYLKIGSNSLREWGVNCGFGMPVPGFKTVVNFSFGYLRRQAHPASLIKEDYFNITFGVNFNEMWFRKAKIY